ncbi:PfkB family carbohydrate kinase [Alkaliphilus transvaalensis]|uniref:PfkB family carbohydrate kinase n=1 Tax=Alkaliphilus transvaalensis TaxID=114628 RepID=UPI00047B373B|nr:PfkB family carbohydrate kinase [Alkaliphilus transvaalensis]
MKKIVGVGENIMDYYLKQKKYHYGGTVINFLMNLSKNKNYSLSYVGPFATDERGNEFKDFIRSAGIDVSYADLIEGNTAISIIDSVKGERIFKEKKHGVYEEFELTEEQLAFIQQHDHIHASVMGRMIQHLGPSKGNATISYDFSILRGLTTINKCIDWVDYSFFSGEDLEHQRSEIINGVNLKAGQQIIFLMGSKGSCVYDGDKLYECPAKKIEVVDTLGAGDSYIAGYIARILEGGTPKEAMEMATEWASSACQKIGGF